MIKNDAELNAILISDFTSIINEITEELLDRLQRIIMEEVYDAGLPSVYLRNGYDGGLIGSFEKTKATVTSNIIESTVEQDPMMMRIDPKNYVHGSYDWVGGTQILVIIICLQELF